MPITSKTPNDRVRLEDDDRAAMKRIAREQDRSYAAQLRHAIRFYLKHMAPAGGED